MSTCAAPDVVDRLALHKATIASQAPGNMAVRGRGKLHWVALGGAEWPMPCWTTVCGWRFALHGSGSELFDSTRLAALRGDWCGKCIGFRARREEKSGGLRAMVE